MALPDILADFLTFFALVFGLGAFWLNHFRGDSIERLTLLAATGVAQIFAAAWLIYLTRAPALVWYALPAASLGGVALRWRELRAFFGEPEVRASAARLLLFSGWCVAWLSLVRSYGGGEWSGDWIEHYQRARFFLEHQPLSTRFFEVYGVTSRPPLANLVVGALLTLRGGGFPHMQVFTALFSALVLLPALLLTRHFGATRRTDAVLLVLAMANPMLIQNATFAWTKLPCAFFVVSGLAFYARGIGESSEWRRTVAVALVALGVLTHYSAAPYAVALVPLHLAWLRTHRVASQRRELAQQLLLAIALLAPWLVWAWGAYGSAGTFLDNPSVTAETGVSLWTRLGYRCHTAWVTLVPHALRSADYQYIAQLSTAGYLRDYWFNIYQTTLPGALGFGGCVLLLGVARARTPGPTSPTWFWGWLVGIVTVENFASIPGLDRWGTAHIGFSPLVIAALAFGAARVDVAGRWLKLICATGLAIDVTLGIALHFQLQCVGFPTPADVRHFLQGETFTYAPAVARNALCKLVERVSFVADGGPPPLLVGLLLAAFATLALAGLRHAPANERRA